MTPSVAHAPALASVPPRDRARQEWRLSIVIPMVLWVLAAAYLAVRLRTTWNLHDEGVLGQSAERVLAGQVPHRDFDDVYTGGLSDFHATVFRVLGTNLFALRIVLWWAYVLWLPVVFYLARRFTTAIPAALVTALAAVWSVPNVIAALPSWYNLFLATAGAAALCRYAEVRRSRWLILAGVAGGLSVLVKIVGVYYLAAAGLVLLRPERPIAEPRRPRDAAYAAAVTGIGLVLVAGLAALLGRVSGYSQYWHFLLPVAAVVAVLVVEAWRGSGATGTGSPVPSGRSVPARIALVALGAAIPVVWFVIPYVTGGATGALVHGVFGDPQRRFQYAVAHPESVRSVWAAAPLLLLFVPPQLLRRARSAGERVVLVVLTVLLGAGLGAAVARGGAAYRVVWLAIDHAGPVILLAAAAALAWRRTSSEDGPVRTEQAWIVVCVAALCTLIQYPYAGSHYVSYVAPLLILAALVTVCSRRGGAGPLPALAGAFFFLFAVLGTNPGHFTVTGLPVPPEEWPTVRLRVPRAGLDVGSREASMYERVVTLVTAHSAPDGYIFAGVDLPEIYFLTQRRNPTRILYDFLDPPAGHDARILAAIDARGVRAAVVRGYEGFSPPMDTVLATALRHRLPDSEAVGPFVVRWRDDAPPVALTHSVDGGSGRSMVP